MWSYLGRREKKTMFSLVMSRDETLHIMLENTSKINKHCYVFMYISQIAMLLIGLVQ